MPVATWEFEEEIQPGQALNYDEDELAYDQDKFDGLDVYYDSIGEATSWTIEAK